MRTLVSLFCVLLLLACGDADPQAPIHIVPIGAVPQPVLAHLVRELPPLIGSPVVLSPGIAVPAVAVDERRSQLLGERLLVELERLHGGNERVLGVVDADVYAPGLNFVFGQARKPGRVALIALPRMRLARSPSPSSNSVLESRALKVAVHELGHTRGYAHCTETHCVMKFANSIGEVDQIGATYCGND